MRLWKRLRGRLAGEAGFTIIEASVAMMIVAIIFTALSFGLIAGLRATRDARLYQQATSIGEEAVEAARDLQYETLSMQTSDLGGDPRITPGPLYDPDGSGSLVPEPIIHSAVGGSIFPHITTQTAGNTQFTISRYVTWVDDTTQGGPAQSYRRVAVIVEWQVGSRMNSYRTSSFVARARRGLPVPKFELSPEAQTVQVEPGNLVVFPHTIRNLGIVDTYDLVMPDPDDRSWVINFYKDTNENGQFEIGVDTLLLDTNSTGVPDTGSVGTDGTVHFLAVFLLGPTEVPGSETMTLTATSGANNAVTHTAANTIEVGTVGLTLYLHNEPSPPTGDTTAQANMFMNPTPPSGGTLFQYSTNLYTSQPGRYIEKKNVADDEADSKFMANWVYQVPQNTLFNGVVEVRFWLALKDLKCDKVMHIRAFLRRKDSSTTSSGTELAQANTSVIPGVLEPCNYQQVTMTMTLANVTVPINKWVELKISNRNATGDAVLVAYDTTTFPSTLELPQVAT